MTQNIRHSCTIFAFELEPIITKNCGVFTHSYDFFMVTTHNYDFFIVVMRNCIAVFRNYGSQCDRSYAVTASQFDRNETHGCRFRSDGIIGPYFFRNEAGAALTVNGRRYRSMITQFFSLSLDDMDSSNMWFQHEDATCHTSRNTVSLFMEKFDEFIIS